MEICPRSQRLRLAAALSLCGLTCATAVAVIAAPPAKNKTALPATTQPGFTDNTPLTADQKILHLLNRAEFGPRPGDFERVKQIGVDAWIDQQLHPDTIDDSAVEAKLASLTALKESDAELAQAYTQQKKIGKERKQLLAQVEREQQAAAKASGQDTMMDSNAAAPATAANAANNPKKFAEALAAMTPEQRAQAKQLQQEKKAQGGFAGPTELVVAKTVRAVESPRQLQEVLVDFWTNHFNIDIRKNACRAYKVGDDREVIRKYSLGKFHDLLEASAKSPAMLVYLDNAQSSGAQANQATMPATAPLRRRGRFAAQRQAVPAKAKANKKGAGLNENYGREIMELHTLGVDGGYTQKDVTEVARCLTGWTIDRQSGDFKFDPRRHDNGQKVVLGHVIPAGGGMQDGETVLDILCSHPSTMKHVSYQLCQRFVCDEPPASLVDKCVATWKRTDGDIAQIVRTILTSNEFNSRLAYQQKIKSPFEFAVSAARALDATCVVADANAPRRENGEGIQRKAGKGYTGGTAARYLPGQVATMGEPLFQCQPPTGYPEDSRKWVSSGALISRLNYALALTSGKLDDISLAATNLSSDPSGTPARIVDQLTARILHGEVSPATRATLLREASQMNGGPTGMRNASYTSGSVASATDARKLTALVLGSPEFQRR